MNHLENPSAMPHVDLSPIITSEEFARAKELLPSIRNVGHFFDTAGGFASTYIRNNLQNLFPYVDKTKAEAVLNSQDFSGVSPTDSEYEDLLTVARSKERLNRKLIKEVVSGENNLGLTEVEKTVLLASCDLADGFDALYYQWRRAVVLGPIAGMQETLGKEETRKTLKERGALIDENISYQYVVFTENEEETFNTLSYAEAFPDEIATISDRIGVLVEDLSQQELDGEEQATELDALITYFGSYKRALMSTNPEEHEDLYRKLDEEWMAIRGRMQPLHMMEVYADPLGVSVEPEYSLAFLDDRFAEINSRTEETKEDLIWRLEYDFSKKKSLKASIVPMEGSLAGVYTFLISGRRLDFRPAGQNVPNREVVRLKDGVKIFIDTKTMYQRWIVQKQLLEKVLGKETVEQDFASDEDIINLAAGVFLIGHEVSHNAFIMDGTRAKIGPLAYKLVEENKADLSVITYAEDFLSDSEQKTFTQGLVGTMFRILTQVNDLSRRPYVNSAICCLNVMEEVGLLRMTDGRWKLDNSAEKIMAFGDRMDEIFRELVDVYDAQSPELAGEFMKTYYSPSEAVTSLIGLINSD